MAMATVQSSAWHRSAPRRATSGPALKAPQLRRGGHLVQSLGLGLLAAASRGSRARKATMEVAEKWFQEQVEGRSSKLAERGLDTLKQLEAPARSQEAFRYTDLDALLYSVADTRKTEVDLKDVLPELLEESKSSEESYRLVFLDGEFQPGHSRLPPSEEAMIAHQVETSSLLEQLPEVDIFQSNKRDSLGCGKLAALNQAVFKDVAYVSLPEGKGEEMVLEMVFLSSGECTAPRSLLEVGAGRHLKVIETHLSLDRSDGALCNGLCRVVAAEGAEVRHEVLQQKGDSARFVQSIVAEVSAGAAYSLRCVQSGSMAARINVAIGLQGEKASGEIKAVMLADEKQQLDLHSLIHHSVPSCRSKQEHKNLVGGAAECIFKGVIKVDAEAQQTESSQLVRSLLLTKKSKVKAMPSLQIQADEVTCSHGAALTQLNPDELFYLASRGLDAANARRLMLRGFPSDLLEGLEQVAPKGHARVLEKLGSMAQRAE